MWSVRGACRRDTREQRTMATQKTLATNANVDAYLQAIEDPARRADCIALAALMQEATMCEPRMWGTAIVGFGSYHYTYESGREGDACVVGFSSRKSEIAVHLPPQSSPRGSRCSRNSAHTRPARPACISSGCPTSA